jgi:electron transport complex protein RnfE
VGSGAGFMVALLMMSSFRELLGNGSLLGYRLLGPHFEPWVIMILPPGGFFTLGFILLGFGWWKSREEEKPKLRRWPHGVVSKEAA